MKNFGGNQDNGCPGVGVVVGWVTQGTSVALGVPCLDFGDNSHVRIGKISLAFTLKIYAFYYM